MRLTSGRNAGDLMVVASQLSGDWLAEDFSPVRREPARAGRIVREATKTPPHRSVLRIPIYDNNRFEHFLAHVFSGTVVMVIADDGGAHPENKSLILTKGIVGWVWTDLLRPLDGTRCH